jgi:tetratricopeptide (TPR) repeat protein
MERNYNIPVGTIDNFHGMRWIIYANLQLGKYDEAFLLLKKLIETGKNEYLNDGVIFDFSQSVALTLLEGDLQSDQRDYLLSILQDVKLSNDKFSKIYLTYVNAIIDYRNGNVKNFDKYIEYIEDMINLSKDGHPMPLFNFKIMHAHMIVYRDILKGELEKAEKNATNALEIENEYVKTIFETGPVISLVPSNELLGVVLLKQNKFQDAINEFLKVGLRFPNRLMEKKYIEECYEKLIHQHRN